MVKPRPCRVCRKWFRPDRKVSQVGEGSFDPLPVESADEVGILAEAFNGFLLRIRHSQQSLENSEKRYRQLFEYAVEGIFQTTKEGRITAANPSLAHILGYGSPEELMSETAEMASSLYRDPEARKELWDRLESSNVIRGFITEFRRRDGGQVWVMINARAVRNEYSLSYIEGFLTDITEEKRQREALLEYQRELETRVESRTRELSTGIENLERNRSAIAELHEFTEMLQLCQGLVESIPVMEAFLPRLFPGTQADLFLLDLDMAMLVPLTGLGSGEFLPNECWALREGKPYAWAESGGRPRCGHLKAFAPRDSLCLPVLAGGEVQGLIQVQGPASLDSELQRHWKNVSESLALALTTLKLRERLREQSIHDPLTGLYNRRYLDEVAQREIRRAARKGDSLGVAMFDIDHFKHFNDEFGHDAGDAVLCQLTRFISSRLRAGDLAFRVGGEEFLLLLAETDAVKAQAKLETLRREVEMELRVEYEQKSLSVTISAGVVAFPLHGKRIEELLKGADVAMYQAKTAGRNRVVALPLPDGSISSADS